MTETTIPLAEVIEATADANGRAVVELTPKTSGEYWIIKAMMISTRSPTGGANISGIFRAFRGVENRSAQVAISFSGADDVAGGAPIDLRAGTRLLGIWSGMTSGCIATLRIEGDRVMRGQRMY